MNDIYDPEGFFSGGMLYMIRNDCFFSRRIYKKKDGLCCTCSQMRKREKVGKMEKVLPRELLAREDLADHTLNMLPIGVLNELGLLNKTYYDQIHRYLENKKNYMPSKEFCSYVFDQGNRCPDLWPSDDRQSKRLIGVDLSPCRFFCLTHATDTYMQIFKPLLIWFDFLLFGDNTTPIIITEGKQDHLVSLETEALVEHAGISVLLGTNIPVTKRGRGDSSIKYSISLEKSKRNYEYYYYWQVKGNWPEKVDKKYAFTQSQTRAALSEFLKILKVGLRGILPVRLMIGFSVSRALPFGSDDRPRAFSSISTTGIPVLNNPEEEGNAHLVNYKALDGKLYRVTMNLHYKKIRIPQAIQKQWGITENKATQSFKEFLQKYYDRASEDEEDE